MRMGKVLFLCASVKNTLLVIFLHKKFAKYAKDDYLCVVKINKF